MNQSDSDDDNGHREPRRYDDEDSRSDVSKDEKTDSDFDEKDEKDEEIHDELLERVESWRKEHQDDPDFDPEVVMVKIHKEIRRLERTGEDPDRMARLWREMERQQRMNALRRDRIDKERSIKGKHKKVPKNFWEKLKLYLANDMGDNQSVVGEIEISSLEKKIFWPHVILDFYRKEYEEKGIEAPSLEMMEEKIGRETIRSFKTLPKLLKKGQVPKYLSEGQDLSGMGIYYGDWDDGPVIHLLLFPQFPAIVGKPIIVDAIRELIPSSGDSQLVTQAVGKYVKLLARYEGFYPRLLPFYKGDAPMVISEDKIWDILDGLLTEVAYRPGGAMAIEAGKDFVKRIPSAK